MTKRVLIGIGYSPWTEKARWALKHHKLPYQYSEHLIMLGMPALRCKMKNWTGDLTVPALIDGEKRVMDSLAIAQYAEEVGQGSKLFPEDRMGEILKFNELCERALDDGRAFVMERISKDKEARKEALPPFIPAFAKGAFGGMVSMAMSYLDREFKVSAVELEERAKRLDQTFSKLDDLVKKSNSDCLLGEFTFADIAATAMLQVVEPVDEKYIKLPAAIRRCWANPSLKAKYPQLLEWRDRIYSQYRPN